VKQLLPRNTKAILGFILTALIYFLLYYTVQKIGFEEVQEYVKNLGIWGPVILILIRCISVVVPMLPGTIYVIFAGSFFGFQLGFFSMCLADMLGAAINFTLGKHLGQPLLEKLLDKTSMDKIKNFFDSYASKNPFLLAAFFSTSWFDYITYACGVFKVNMISFICSAVVSRIVVIGTLTSLGAGIVSNQIFLFVSFVGFIILGCLRNGVQNMRTSKSQKVDS
jgi:uncharacterized membrane protein YdjX (TVP38/TMEM64 family)